MISYKRISVVLLITVLVVCSVTLAAIALEQSTPLMFFTDNIEAGGASSNLTDMEAALINRLDGATTSIDAAIYGFSRPSVRDALIAAHGRGVTVRVVTDDDAFEDATYQPFFADLEAAGITVINDKRSSIMHNKFFVIDGEIVWTGSTNLTDTGFTYNHNSSLVFTSTLLADIYTIEFNEMFEDGLFGTAKTNNVTHTLDYNGIPLEVYFSPSDEAMNEVLSAVATADESIRFGIFFFTDDSLRDAMVGRLQSGVSVSGVWDNLGASNQYSEDEVLCQAGAQIKIEDFGGKLHNKFMIIDAGSSDPVVITGSMNWSASGDEANDENTLLIYDEAVAQTYLAAYQELFDALGNETLCTNGEGEFFIYLPLISKPIPPTPTPTSTPTPTNTPQPSATPMPAASPTPSATPTQPPQSSGDVVIVSIFYNGAGSQEPDEYVQIRNDDNVAIQLSGWTLRDIANHVFTFPSFIMQPGQQCRVYTNENHPEWCGFNYGNGAAIWNNSGDTAFLRDNNGNLVDSCSYSGGGTSASCD